MNTFDQQTAIVIVCIFVVAERILAALVNWKALKTQPRTDYVTEERLQSFRIEQERVLILNLEVVKTKLEGIEKSNQHVLRLLYKREDGKDDS